MILLRRQMEIGKLVMNQRSYENMVMLELEIKNKINQMHEKVEHDLKCENYEELYNDLKEMEGYLSDLIELNYDMDNCKSRINKGRNILGLAEMKEGA